MQIEEFRQLVLERQKRAAEREERKVKSLERIADVLEQLWDSRRPGTTVDGVPEVREVRRVC